jgi:hypothetical protein
MKSPYNKAKPRRARQATVLTLASLNAAQKKALANGEFVNGYPGLRELGVPHDRIWIWNKIREGRFPKPVALGGGRLWFVSDIKQWLTEQPLVQMARKVGA